MKPEDFELQHSDIPQPQLLDEQIATHAWLLPPAKPWAPMPRQESLLDRIVEVLR